MIFDTLEPVEIFSALADGTRRRIVELLARGERTAGELASEFSSTRPAVAHHLKVLRDAGLVRRRVDAQRRVYSLDPSGLEDLDRWVSTQRQFWNRQLNRLDERIRADLVAGATPERRDG
jgi:DNA-binding transcriptional ArsR family regulator